MAPNPLSVIFDYRGQIVENCEFLCDKDDFISIITVKDAEARHKAIAVRTNDDDRGAFLASEPCDSVQEAIESLHTKSEEAANLYITTNGYAQPPSLKKDTFDDDDDDADTASVFSDQSYNSSIPPPPSVSEGSESEVLTPASSSKEKSTTDKPVERPNTGRKGPPQRGPKIIPRTSSYDDSDDDDSVVSYRRYSPKPAEPVGGHPQPSYNASIPPPPSPAAPAGYWGNWPPPPPAPHPPYPASSAARAPAPGIPPMTFGPDPSPAPPTGSQAPPPAPPVITCRPPMPPGPPKPPKPQPPQPIQLRDLPTTTTTTTRPFPVRLTIEWLQHGQVQILESCRPSPTSLQSAARAYVRKHPDAFANVTPRDRSPLVLFNLHVAVKRAFFGDGEPYALSAATEDLSRWFAVVGASDIPRFEIEVEYRQPPPPPPPAPVASSGAGPGATAMPVVGRLSPTTTTAAPPFTYGGVPAPAGIIKKRSSKPGTLPSTELPDFAPPGPPATSEEAAAEEVSGKGSRRPGSTNSSPGAVYSPSTAPRPYPPYPGVMGAY